MTAAIATGLSYGTHPINEHATTAVQTALDKAGITQAQSVLLFMTPEYLRDPATPVRLAAKTANCLQVTGSIGYGILTEEEWLLDSPGIAAMVFGGLANIAPLTSKPAAAILSISTPAGFTPEWLHDPVPHIGAIVSDPLGQGDYKLWRGARVKQQDHLAMSISNVRAAFAVAQSFRPLTQPGIIGAVDGLDILSIDGLPALEVLMQALPSTVTDAADLPLHLLLGGVSFGKPENAIDDGRFHLDHIISTNPDTHSITLTSEMQPGDHLFLAIRDTHAAELAMRHAVESANRILNQQPDFGLMFPCLGRGPSFYGGRDRDIEILHEAHPDMPFIGIYGNGEIGPLMDANHVYQYSTSLGLFSVDELDMT